MAWAGPTASSTAVSAWPKRSSGRAEPTRAHPDRTGLPRHQRRTGTSRSRECRAAAPARRPARTGGCGRCSPVPRCCSSPPWWPACSRVRQRNRAEDAASARDAAATLAEARRSGARALVVDGYDQALLLGVEGRHVHESLETNRNLLAAIQRSPDAIGVIGGDETGRFRPRLHPRRQNVAGQRHRRRPRPDVRTTSPPASAGRLPGPGENLIVRSALSPDGHLAVVADSPTYFPDSRQFELQLVDLDTFTAVGQPLPAFAGDRLVASGLATRSTVVQPRREAGRRRHGGGTSQ